MTKPAPLDLSTACLDPSVHAYGVLLEAMAELNRTFDRSLQRSAGISHTSFEGLLRLERSGGILTMGELTSQIALTGGGVTRLVARLVDAGLAERRPCESDRRIQYVAITDPGRSVLADAMAVHLEDLQKHFTGVMTTEERETITAAMERIRHRSLVGDGVQHVES